MTNSCWNGFRVWCQKVLPLVYDDSLSYYEVLCKTLGYLNEFAEKNEMLENEFNELKSFVENYFNNLDVQNEINKKLDEMLKNGILETILKSFLNRKFIFIGDSYILGYSNDGNIYNSYANIITQTFGLDATILGVSGSGFANKGDGPNEGKNYTDILKSYSGSESDKLRVTDIYVIGGYNDRTHSTTEIWLGADKFYKYAKENFPNAKLHCGFIGWCQVPEEYNKLEQACLAYSRCGIYGFEYMTNSEYILHSSHYFTNDNVHPNNEGHSALASYLSSDILGGKIDVVQQRSEMQIPAINNMQLTKIYSSQHNNIITTTMTDFCTIDMSLIDPTYWGTIWVQISEKITPTMILGYTESYAQISVLINTEEDNKWYSCPATIKLVNGAFYLQIQAIAINGSGLYNGKIKQCLIPPFTITSPTLLS